MEAIEEKIQRLNRLLKWYEDQDDYIKTFYLIKENGSKARTISW